MIGWPLHIENDVLSLKQNRKIVEYKDAVWVIDSFNLT